MHVLRRHRAPLGPRLLLAGRALLASSLAVLTALAASTAPAAGQGVNGERPADVCFEARAGALAEGEWAVLTELVRAVVASRPSLFPHPDVLRGGARLDVHSGHDGLASRGAPCLAAGHDWSARFSREFLQAGAERMLAEAPTTPGIESNVTVEWHPAETRLRTLLQFAGPFDIPNGRCWIDDVLAVDAVSGTVTASGEQGLATSPFAEGACGRFYDHLPQGGAGEQAVTLLPQEVVDRDDGTLRFMAEAVSVLPDAVAVSGRIERTE